nr:hypothetical protein Iba_chr07fCG2710 [Ipomoea batatas]
MRDSLMELTTPLLLSGGNFCIGNKVFALRGYGYTSDPPRTGLTYWGPLAGSPSSSSSAPAAHLAFHLEDNTTEFKKDVRNSEPVRCGFDSTDLVCDALPLLQVYFLAQLPFSSACKTSKNGIAVGTPNRKRILVMGKFQALCIASVVGIASIHCFHFGAL